MGEDLDNHLGINDGGDDLQAPATAQAAFDVNIGYPFEPGRVSLCVLALRAVGRSVAMATIRDHNSVMRLPGTID